jgi:two-component system KDP operon response regulator KdpE
MDDRLCVVVVDDDPEYRDFMQLLLESAGYRTVRVRTLAEVKGILAADRPHLVICDARLPDTAPFAVLDVLRTSPQAAGVPVLLCTGAVAEVEERRSELARTGVQVLTKPFDIDVLLGWVAQLCGRPTATDPERPTD